MQDPPPNLCNFDEPMVPGYQAYDWWTCSLRDIIPFVMISKVARRKGNETTLCKCIDRAITHMWRLHRHGAIRTSLQYAIESISRLGRHGYLEAWHSTLSLQWKEGWYSSSKEAGKLVLSTLALQFDNMLLMVERKSSYVPQKEQDTPTRKCLSYGKHGR